MTQPDGVTHALAAPYPTRQGTQVAVRAMLDASADAQLLTYGVGDTAQDSDARIVRGPSWPQPRSFRSGPSWEKIVLDAQMSFLLRRHRHQVVFAHHVEAAAAAWVSGVRSWVFVAHTDLGCELPTYFAPRYARVCRGLGRSVDAWLGRHAPAVAAVAPALTKKLSRQMKRPVSYLPVPWPLHSPLSTEERARARRQWRLGPNQPVLLYTGNLDRYQGWESALGALSRLEDLDAALVLATDSSPAPVWAVAQKLGMASRLRMVPLQAESDRRWAHAASDVAVVPRSVPGGVPIKLLEALSYGLPAVITPHASAGLELPARACTITQPRPQALAAGVRNALQRAAAASAARDYIEQHHSQRRYLQQLDALPMRLARSAAATNRASELSSANSATPHHRYASCSGDKTTSPQT